MATATTAYVIRAGKRGEYAWLDNLLFQSTNYYSWCKRSKAKRFIGRPAADQAIVNLKRIMAERGYDNVPVVAVPARGGMACSAPKGLENAS